MADNKIPVTKQEIRPAKKKLRDEIKCQRDKLLLMNIYDLSLKIQKNLFSLQEFTNAHIIMYYLSFKSEVDTFAMIAETLDMGKNVVVPLVNSGKKQISAVQIFNLKDDIEPGAFGIPEPVDKINIFTPKKIGLVLVPGVVFNTSGYRIGYGGGYYDKWLKDIAPERRIGLAFDFQVMDREIPRTKYDLPVNKIVTEKRIISITHSRKEID